jgi:hypothetical protein
MPSDQPAPFSEKRIKDASQAKAVYDKFRSDSEPRRKSLSKVLNQINGGKPFSDADLVKNGQGWRCNINFRDASSTLEQVLVGYWRLLHDTTNLASVTVHTDTPNAEEWQALLEQNFNRFVEDWGDSYVRNYLQFAFNHTTSGVGVVIWPDRYSARWETVRIGDLETDNEAVADVSNLEVAAIRQKMTISKLWELIRTPEKQKSSAELGWNVAALRKFLWKAVNGDRSPQSPDNFIEIEDQIRNNSYSVSTTTGPLEIVTLLVKEFDGKVSKYVFSPAHDSAGFLFDDSSKAYRPEDMRQIIGAVFFEAGNGLFWGSKGFGQKNYQLATVMNRLKSRAVDRTILDGLTFIDKSDGGMAQVPVTNIGPFNIIPSGLEQVPSYPTGMPTLETIAMLENTVNTNNARYRDQSTQIANTDTARQATILANIQSQVDVANATLYLAQVARNIFAEQFRRLRLRGNTDADAKAFKKRCVEDGGMDEKFFHEAEISLRTGADPGAASVALQGEKAKELLAFSGDPNVNTRWAWEKYVSANFGASAVKRALNPVDHLGDIAAQRLALMENSDMGEGNQIPVDPKDNHIAHLPAHLQPLAVIVHNYEATGRIDPTAVVALQNAIPHVEEHFNFLKADKTKQPLYQQLWPQYTEIRNGAVSILRQVERMANEAQMQQGQTPPGGVDPQAAVGAMTPQ